jgi:phage terminase small subunit
MRVVEGGLMAGTLGRSGGHNRRSIADHQLRGTFRPSRHNGQIQAAAGPPVPVPRPARLSAGAATVWDRLAPLALTLGTLTPVDETVFATLCELQATLEAASAQKDTPAALKRERDAAAAVRPFYALFGLTLEARRRLHVGERAVPRVRSKWDELA